MKKEQLIFKGVSEIVGTENLGLLILTDKSSERQISIVCDKAMAVQIELRIKRIPVTNILLPEVLCKCMRFYEKSGFELLIDNLVDGQYRTIVCNSETGEKFLIRASDAVLLSLIADIPLYIEERLMKRQSVIYRGNSKGVSLPVNTISDEMLQAALDKAIAEENYELASRLRDEKKMRDNKGGQGLSGNNVQDERDV